MKKLIPAILALIGLAVGTTVGHFLKPKAEEIAGETPAAHSGDQAQDAATEQQPAEDAKSSTNSAEKYLRRSERNDDSNNDQYEYVKLNNQFVVPVVNGTRVAALVVMSLSIEVAVGKKEAVFVREPKLRDAFLQVLFNHANSGGFDGAFTTGEKMNDLHGSLFEAAFRILGAAASDVLIIDIVRQDV